MHVAFSLYTLQSILVNHFTTINKYNTLFIYNGRSRRYKFACPELVGATGIFIIYMHHQNIIYVLVESYIRWRNMKLVISHVQMINLMEKSGPPTLNVVAPNAQQYGCNA